MKGNHLLAGVGCFLIMACNFNNETKENISQESETQNEEANQQEGEVTSEEDFLIQDQAAGIFKIGNAISTTLEGITHEKEQQTRLTEEGPTEETVFIVMEGPEEVLHILPAVDHKTGENTGDIGELRIISAIYKTSGGIGVGSSLEEFIARYPNYKIWYTYVSDRYVLEAEEVDAQFLLKEEDFVGDLEITSVMTPLPKEDFKKGARISLVRIIP